MEQWVVLVDTDDHSVRLVHRWLGRITIDGLVLRDVTLHWVPGDLDVFLFLLGCL